MVSAYELPQCCSSPFPAHLLLLGWLQFLQANALMNNVILIFCTQGGQFELGDRVVSVLKEGVPPFGFHGTVIGE